MPTCIVRTRSIRLRGSGRSQGLRWVVSRRWVPAWEPAAGRYADLGDPRTARLSRGDRAVRSPRRNGDTALLTPPRACPDHGTRVVLVPAHETVLTGSEPTQVAF